MWKKTHRFFSLLHLYTISTIDLLAMSISGGELYLVQGLFPSHLTFDVRQALQALGIRFLPGGADTTRDDASESIAG
jgi:hypothetical protein